MRVVVRLYLRAVVLMYRGVVGLGWGVEACEIVDCFRGVKSKPPIVEPPPVDSNFMAVVYRGDDVESGCFDGVAVVVFRLVENGSATV